MAELLKNIYNKSFFDLLCEVLEKRISEFNKRKFLNGIYDDQWESRELKERMRHIAITLRKFLPQNYVECLAIIENIVEDLKQKDRREMSLGYIFLPDFLEVYGLDDYKNSVQAMESITQLVSAEFCIRPFIIKYPQKMMKQLLVWSKHKNHHVRRLASEGCRPRLPWAMALPELKKDPSSIFPILENLKNDGSEYVRRSVANNLNDIAKDHPDLVIKLAGQWMGKSAETDKLLKHACRTLLKKAHPHALKHFGFHVSKVFVSPVSLSKKTIKKGETLEFNFKLELHQKKSARLRVEYAIYYMKSNGKQSRKIFQLTENNFSHGNVVEFKRKQSFKDFTTRKHYPGKHKLAIVVNGEEKSEVAFSVI